MVQDQLISLLLRNRDLITEEQIADFFNPPHPEGISISRTGLSPESIQDAIKLLDKHLSAGHRIAVWGDYDVDGICGTAIIWETLYAYSHRVFPYIPNRRTEGYGLSVGGIDSCLKKQATLIIVIDSGIVSHPQIQYALDRGCEVLVIDHHQPESVLPPATAILHSQATTAAGLAWFFCREFLMAKNQPPEISNEKLGLAAISVICDLVPLLGINRSLAGFGLKQLNHTSRPGLLALFAQAGIHPGNIGSYEVGFIIGPRLNATGRLDNALDSLRLLCTNDSGRAGKLAVVLEETNSLRQNLTFASFDYASSLFDNRDLPPLLITADRKYDEGVIGLIAARLVEKYYRPAIVVSMGETKSKASARSIPGFHITDFLRRFERFFASVGGHAMAAGFTIDTAQLPEINKKLTDQAKRELKSRILVRNQRVDAEISLTVLDRNLYAKLEAFRPFGLGNPRPVFVSRRVAVSNPRRIGGNHQHLKFTTGGPEAIYFSAPPGVESGINLADITYSLDLNIYQGRENLQMVIKQMVPG